MYWCRVTSVDWLSREEHRKGKADSFAVYSSVATFLAVAVFLIQTES